MTSRLYLALTSIGALFGGPNISPDPMGSRLRITQSKEGSPIGNFRKDSEIESNSEFRRSLQ